MRTNFNKLLKALAAIMLMPFLLACATYNKRIQGYYGYMAAGNYVAANQALDNIKLLKKQRNLFLYKVEKGRVMQLLKQYDTSNMYLNEADHLAEDARTSASDVAVGTLVNPMMQPYKPEAFEKFMLHYYKAINYLQLGKRDEALVEARRITIQANEQNDKYGDKTNRYGKDAFSFILQGVIYESAGDINNAFIAYRNAAETYLAVPSNTWYGVHIPEQLKQDVLRTAYANGFMDEVSRFEKLFNITYQQQVNPPGGELIYFVEKGRVAVKGEQNISFVLSRNGLGNFFFSDQNSSLQVPFDFSVGINASDLAKYKLETFRIALPKYIPQAAYYTQQYITNNGAFINPEKVQDISTLAIETLRERFLKELGLALSRLAVKKIAEFLIRGSESKKDSVVVGKNGETTTVPKSKTSSIREGIATALEIYSFFSEKADTRNWQSLPADIYIARIPLELGENKVALILSNGRNKEDSVTVMVKGTGKLQFYNYASLR